MDRLIDEITEAIVDAIMGFLSALSGGRWA